MNKFKICILVGFLALFLSGFLVTQNLSLSSGGLPIVEGPQVNEEFELSDGESWLTGWSYRQKLAFWEVDGSGTNYPVDLHVFYDERDNSLQVETLTKCQTDFGDIRFTDNDGSTELDYWMETKVDSDEAVFWIEVVDSLETGNSVVIYIYYGTSGTSTTTSDGEEVFYFFDDFENNNLNRWDIADSDWSTQATTVKMGSYAALGDSTGSRQLYSTANNFTSGSFLIHTWFRVEDHTVQDHRYGIHMYGDTHISGVIAYQNDWMWWNGGQVNYETNTVVADTWYRVELGLNLDASNVTFYRDRSYIGFRDFHDYTDTDVAYVDQVGCLTDGQADGNKNDQYQDDYYVRKWVEASVEPYINVVYGEEAAPVAPENYDAVCTNPTDTDNIYMGYGDYIFTSNTSDADGCSDITYVDLYAYDWKVRYTVSTTTFSEIDGSGIVLNTGSSSVIASGNWLNITWLISFEWSLTDSTQEDLKLYVIDSVSESDTDIYDLDYDYLRSLDTTLTLDDGSGTADRGDYDTVGGIDATGTVVYAGTATTVKDGTVDVIITSPSILGSPWTGTTTTGVYSIAVDSDDETALVDTYTVKLTGDGYDTDLDASPATDTYIADAVVYNIETNATAVVGSSPIAYSVAVTEYMTFVLEDATYVYDDGNADGDLYLNDTITDETYIVSTQKGLWVRLDNNTHGITKCLWSTVYGIKTNITVYWESVVMSSSPAYKWTQYSPDEVWLIVDTAKFTWELSGRSADGVVIQSQINGTADDWGEINSDGYIGDLVLGGNPTNNAFSSAWYHANISLYWQYNDVNSIMWTRILQVDILHSIHIEDSVFELNDDWLTVGFQINWNNGTFYVYDNGTYIGGSYMGLYQVAKSTVIGLHVITVVVNGTQGTIDSTTQNYTASSSDGWKVLTYRYTINPVDFSITDPFCMQNNETVVFSAIFYTGDLTIDYTVYEDGVAITTGILTIPSSGSYYVVKWLKSSATSVANWSISLMSGTTNITVYGYNIIVDNSEYVYNSSGYFEGDDYFIGDSEEQLLARAADSMWDTLGSIILLLTLPVVVGIAIKVDRSKSVPRGKRDKRNDGML